MLSSTLFAASIICCVAALYWYFSGVVRVAAQLNLDDPLNDPILEECRAELDDHTHVLRQASRATPQ